MSTTKETSSLPILTIEKLKVSIQRKRILTDISFCAMQGKCIGIIGPPSAGKSVLLKVIAQLMPSSKGTIKYAPNMLNSNGELKAGSVGMAFQNNALFDFLNVYENVRFPLLQLSQHTDYRQRIQSLLDEVELSSFEDYAVKDLSGGMQRRLGIARAIATEPTCALFDDPSAGLDPVTSNNIFSLLHDYTKRRNACSIIVSSDINTLFSWVDDILLLADGKQIFWGSPSDANQSTHPLVQQFIHGLEHGPL